MRLQDKVAIITGGARELDARRLNCLPKQTINNGVIVLDDWRLLSQNQEVRSIVFNANLVF